MWSFIPFLILFFYEIKLASQLYDIDIFTLIINMYHNVILALFWRRWHFLMLILRNLIIKPIFVMFLNRDHILLRRSFFRSNHWILSFFKRSLFSDLDIFNLLYHFIFSFIYISVAFFRVISNFLFRHDWRRCFRIIFSWN